MFTQPCFIRKNNSDLKKRLEFIGYKIVGLQNQYKGSALTGYRPKFNQIIASTNGHYSLNYCSENSTLLYTEGDKTGIDCVENEILFLAIAALRDDSDVCQWFVNNRGEWILSNRDKFFSQQHLNTEDEFNEIKALDYFILTESHKATVKELIEHFK